jgi:four helix bundle protein
MRYQELVVWQRAMELVERVYRLARKVPVEERFGLASQMRRSSRSIPANIAEGYGRGKTGDYLRHLSIANGSLFELETGLELAIRTGALDAVEVESARKAAEEVGRLLWALRRKLNALGTSKRR